MFQRILTRAVGGVASAVLATACASGPGTQASAFDGVAWRNADPRDPGDRTRCAMVQSAQTLIVDGMGVDEAVALLGVGRTVADAGELVYLVGACNTYGVDLDELRLTIDDGVVVSTRIVQG